MTEKRPDRWDTSVTEMALDRIVPPVMEYLKTGGEAEDADESDVREEIRKAIRYEDDAYKICRKLEHSGWDPDAELVDVLDRVVSRERYASHEAVIKQWVQRNAITVPFSIGDRVTYTGRANSGIPSEGIVGNIFADTAQIVLTTPDKFAKRDPKTGFCGGTYVNVEDLAPAGT